MIETNNQVDPRAAFLARAGGMDALFSAGATSLDEAFERLYEPFMAIVAPMECETCGNTPCSRSSFCAACKKADAEVRRSRQSRNASTQPTPVEALIYDVRARGRAAWDDPANKERWSRCDAKARVEIKRRLTKGRSEAAA